MKAEEQVISGVRWVKSDMGWVRAATEDDKAGEAEADRQYKEHLLKRAKAIEDMTREAERKALPPEKADAAAAILKDALKSMYGTPDEPTTFGGSDPFDYDPYDYGVDYSIKRQDMDDEYRGGPEEPTFIEELRSI